MAQVVWGVFVLSSIRRWTADRGMPQLKSEVLFWITLACAVYGAVLFHELGHFVLGDIVRFRLIGFGVGPLSWTYTGGRWRAHLRYDKLFGRSHRHGAHHASQYPRPGDDLDAGRSAGIGDTGHDRQRSAFY